MVSWSRPLHLWDIEITIGFVVPRTKVEELLMKLQELEKRVVKDEEARVQLEAEVVDL